MNFAVLPPEANSARMFAGAGRGPMLAAAAAWEGLAEELDAAAASFAGAVSELAGEAWLGPAAAQAPLEPLRAIPLVGDPLADVAQPDLRVLVELGYDRAAYQYLPTPFGLLPDLDPAVLSAELQQAAVQGADAALADVGSPPLVQRIG